MNRLIFGQQGFVLVFGLLIIPIFLGFGLLIIDAGRGNNAHADLQAAADAVALAGARELDGGPDAITRAQAAMDNFQNSVSMLGMTPSNMHIPLVYSASPGNEFFVAFLTDIPNNDTTPITPAWLAANSTTSGVDAEFVYVRAQSQNLQTAFFNPITLFRESVPVAAIAVATYSNAVCDIPPIYICNPFEFVTDPSTGQQVYNGHNLKNHFHNGDFHGRMIRLHPAGNQTHAPGNFGLLDQPNGGGANAISDFFAGAPTGTCYRSDIVTTKPGASNGIRHGLNTRFDMYQGNFSNPNNLSFTPLPAENNRKGMLPKVSNNGTIDDCVGSGNNAARIVDDHVYDLTLGIFNADGVDENAYGLPDNNVMLQPNQGVAGAAIGADDNWAIDTYFLENYGMPQPPVGLVSSVAGKTPSRYDVYLYEIANQQSLNQNRHPGDQVGGVDTGEMGHGMCSQSMGISANPAVPDRRVIPGAVIDCNSQPNSTNGKSDLVVNTYVSMFMTRPMVKYNPSTDETIDIEIVDIIGNSGNGNLEIYVREEALLVR